MKKRFAALAVVLCLLLAACGARGQAPVSQPESSSSSSSAVAAPDHPPAGEVKPLYFSLGPEGEVKALYPGDALGDWTLEGYEAEWDEGADGLPWVYDARFDAPADAPIELHCEVYLSPMASETRVYFFDVMLEDHGKIPVMEGVNSRLWFGSGATDALDALEALGPNDRWSCRVGVSRYGYCHLAMEAYDLADIAWLEVESTEIEPPVPDGRPSGPFLSEDGMLLPPPVPHGLELDGIDFSTLDKTGIISLLEPVLERAGFFCKFGLMTNERFGLGIEVDLSPEERLEIPYLDFGFSRNFYPCLNLPYQTMEEFRRDVGTVFSPDVLENHLQNVFDNYTDHEGRLYMYAGDGYSVERDWKLDELEIVTAEKTRLTISAPVSMAYGPSSGEYFTARLNFEILDGYIVVDDSYFAKDPS